MNRKRNSEVGRYFRACDLLDIARRGKNEPRIKRLTMMVSRLGDIAANELAEQNLSRDNAIQGLRNTLREAFGNRQQLSA